MKELMGAICKKLSVNVFIYDYSGYSCSFNNKGGKDMEMVLKEKVSSFCIFAFTMKI